MKKHTLDHIPHHDTGRWAYFVNGIGEELVEEPIDWKQMKLAERLSGVCKFISTAAGPPLKITLYFCDGYDDALNIAKANLLPDTSGAKWGVNGSVMYLVETENREKLSEILGFFAGKE